MKRLGKPMNKKPKLPSMFKKMHEKQNKAFQKKMNESNGINIKVF